MTCESLMTTHLPTLRHSDMVEQAVQALLDHRVPGLPVVDDQGRYLGIFSLCRLLGQLLPKAATLDGGLPDLAYVNESFADVRERFQNLKGHRVGDYLDTKVTVLHPDTPLMQTVLTLYRSQNLLPVVEEHTHKLVGVVSSWDALAALKEKT